MPLSKAYENVLSARGLSTYNVSALIPALQSIEHASNRLDVKFLPRLETRI
jgi:hypothetical protein